MSLPLGLGNVVWTDPTNSLEVHERHNPGYSGHSSYSTFVLLDKVHNDRISITWTLKPGQNVERWVRTVLRRHKKSKERYLQRNQASVIKLQNSLKIIEKAMNSLGM
jgi:uncharacterized protein YndB with AHSA1/START domain